MSAHMDNEDIRNLIERIDRLTDRLDDISRRIDDMLPETIPDTAYHDEPMSAEFDDKTIHYLETLPAVVRATRKRITYTREFQQHVRDAYRNGERPVDIFRRAGLGPGIIGYKRIERCIARWARRTDE